MAADVVLQILLVGFLIVVLGTVLWRTITAILYLLIISIGTAILKIHDEHKAQEYHDRKMREGGYH